MARIPRLSRRTSLLSPASLPIVNGCGRQPREREAGPLLTIPDEKMKRVARRRHDSPNGHETRKWLPVP